MSKVLIEISDLRKYVDGDTIKDLADFIEERLEGVEIDMTGSEVIVSAEDEDSVVPRSYLRVIIRKFLHKEDLKDFRVIAGKESSFIIKQRRVLAAE